MSERLPQKPPDPLLGVGVQRASPEWCGTVEEAFVDVDVFDQLDGVAEPPGVPIGDVVTSSRP